MSIARCSLWISTSVTLPPNSPSTVQETGSSNSKRSALGSTLRLFMAAGAKTAASELNPVSLLLRHLPLQKLADGLEKP